MSGYPVDGSLQRCEARCEHTQHTQQGGCCEGHACDTKYVLQGEILLYVLRQPGVPAPAVVRPGVGLYRINLWC
jgi:hypothetical protein